MSGFSPSVPMSCLCSNLGLCLRIFCLCVSVSIFCCFFFRLNVQWGIYKDLGFLFVYGGGHVDGGVYRG